jgi:hypothetical protein
MPSENSSIGLLISAYYNYSTNSQSATMELVADLIFP